MNQTPAVLEAKEALGYAEEWGMGDPAMTHTAIIMLLMQALRGTLFEIDRLTEYTLGKASIATRAAREDAAKLQDLLDRFKDTAPTRIQPVFLDGRNEHGSHVLTYSLSPDLKDEDIVEDAEDILKAAEAAGYEVGQHVITTWEWFADGEYGEGYWSFVGIDKELTDKLINNEVPPEQVEP